MTFTVAEPGPVVARGVVSVGHKDARVSMGKQIEKFVLLIDRPIMSGPFSHS
jgi:hypothetical protein